MDRTHVFIISWAGQHESAVTIARALRGVAARITVVYSDPDPDLALPGDCEGLRRPDELFWGDKFNACLGAFDSDLLLVIHADCRCADWPELVRRCAATMQEDPGIGVWAPLIQGANLDIRKTHIADLRDTTLSVVAQTDAIVFALSRAVVARMKEADYGMNLYGWGIDDMAAAYCFSRNLLVVVDKSLPVDHPVSSGYPKEAAERQKGEFLRQLTFAEAVQHRLLWSCIKVNYASLMAQFNRGG